MLRELKNLEGFTVHAVDGDIGKVHDFYFDDKDWTVRYVVVDTGPWLVGRRVLLSTHALQPVMWTDKTLPVNLTQEQVENSPETDLNEPVSRQHQIELHEYYGWPAYWAGGAMMGAGMAAPNPMAAGAAAAATAEETDLEESEVETVKSHLRSVNEVTGYHIAATDGEIGHVSDFFASEMEWIIRYMLVDTRNWLPGRKVLISPDWIEAVDWADAEVVINHTREQVKQSPEFDPKGDLTRDYEANLYNHYDFPYYWASGV